MEEKLTTRQAYNAMFLFVKAYYYRKGKPEEIGSLLSDLQPLSYLLNDPLREGSSARLDTADPASWDDWLVAVSTVVDEENLGA